MWCIELMCHRGPVVKKDGPSAMNPNQRVNEYKQLRAASAFMPLCQSRTPPNAPGVFPPFHPRINTVEQIKCKIPPLLFYFGCCGGWKPPGSCWPYKRCQPR